MTRNDQNLMFSDIENNVWSNKFALKNNSHINAKMDAVYREFVDSKTLSYKHKPKSLVRLLKDPKHAKYQSKLLSKYFEEPEKYLKLDCDYLSIQVDCSGAKTVELLTDLQSGIEKLRTKALMEILTVEHEKHVGKANNGLGTVKEPKAPFFTSVYRLKLFNDRRKFFYIYIADGSLGLKGKRVQIDFIPSRFTNFEIGILFGHIKSVLKNRAYLQFIAKARYKRVDVAFNMPGVFQPFVFPAYLDINNINAGSCWPPEQLVETCYVGNRSSNHFIIYDKILKEMKTDVNSFVIERADVPQAIKQLAMTTRIERRFYTNRAGHKSTLFQKSLLLSLIAEQAMPLNNVAVIDPIALQKVDKELLLDAVYTKSRWQDASNEETAMYRISQLLSGHPVYRLDKTVFESMKTTMLNELFKNIQNPHVVKSDELKPLSKLNYPSYSFELPLPFVLNKKVSKAFESERHYIVLRSGAGCGKTTQIVSRTVWLISEKGVDAKKITLLAYTNDAVKELKQRIRKELRLHYGKSNFLLPNIQTFSAWCGQQLKKHQKRQYGTYAYIPTVKEKGASIKTRIEYLHEIITLDSKIKGSAEDYDSLFSYSANDCKPNLRKLITSINSKRGNDLKINADNANTVFDAYKNLKAEKSLWDFDDVLTLMNKSMKKTKFAKKVSQFCEHLILDEMQDSNLVQWQILNKLSSTGIKLFCVGDTAQSIYGFRGASPDRFEKFADDDDVKFFNTKHSFRSTSRILRLTNFVRRYTQSFPRELTTSNVEGFAPELIEHDDLKDLASDLSNKLILLAAESGPKTSVLILARTNKVVDTINVVITKALKAKKHKLLVKQISVMTMHKAKGLEADICCVVDPRYSRSSYDSRDEYLRLMYVALTRARKRLIICRNKTKDNSYTDGHEGEPDIIDILKENVYLFK